MAESENGAMAVVFYEILPRILQPVSDTAGLLCCFVGSK
jgi:hypothetical protein